MILREFPPNPNIVNYYTREQLTTMMSERYKPGRREYPKAIVTRLSRIDGISAIHILRHKLRLKKFPRARWNTIVPSVEQILRDEWESDEIQSVKRDDIRRTFPMPRGMFFEKRQVFEGVDHARRNPLAARLYRIKGIATVLLYQNQITIKRSCCFPWEELEPKIASVLANAEE